MTKLALILASLVEESAQKPDRDIEKEILEELSKPPMAVPWLKDVKKVTIVEV